MCDSGTFPKKPRLFYWEEAEDAWLPACLALDKNYADAELDNMDENEVREIRIKRIDMTDEEFGSMPES